MDLESSLILMELFILDNGKMENNMVQDMKYGGMVLII
jgi:hypothetical protein